MLDSRYESDFHHVGDQIAIRQGLPPAGKTMAEIDALLPGYGTLLKRIYRAGFEARTQLAFRGWYTRPEDKHFPSVMSYSCQSAMRASWPFA